jgi:hypothetical protein
MSMWGASLDIRLGLEESVNENRAQEKDLHCWMACAKEGITLDDIHEGVTSIRWTALTKAEADAVAFIVSTAIGIGSSVEARSHRAPGRCCPTWTERYFLSRPIR